MPNVATYQLTLCANANPASKATVKSDVQVRVMGGTISQQQRSQQTLLLVSCTDINECLDPQACGLNAECVNLPGNYTCQCREGYYGDPYNGCVDVDECVQPGVCGPGAICTNLEGGYRCDCPQGFDGDARSAQGCLDYDECARSPCGRNALCRNEVGSFRCECQQGFSGDPMTDCQGKWPGVCRESGSNCYGPPTIAFRQTGQTPTNHHASPANAFGILTLNLHFAINHIRLLGTTHDTLSSPPLIAMGPTDLFADTYITRAGKSGNGAPNCRLLTIAHAATGKTSCSCSAATSQTSHTTTIHHHNHEPSTNSAGRRGRVFR